MFCHILLAHTVTLLEYLETISSKGGHFLYYDRAKVICINFSLQADSVYENPAFMKLSSFNILTI